MINRLFKKTLVLSALVSLSFVASGCDLAKNQLKIDRSGNMEVQDYRDSFAPRIPEATEKNAVKDDKIPELSSYVADATDNLTPMPTVSITVNQTVPLKDLLYQLAEQADYDIEIDPRITGSIIFTARDRPFDQVIDRISEIAGLRYKFSNDSLRVELDTPYQKTYKIDYLSYVRSNSSSIKNEVSVAAGGEGSAGSTFTVSTKSEADFWGDLASSLQQMLGTPESTGNLRTNFDPQITAAAPNPAPVEPVVSQVVGPDGQPQVQVQPPQATLDVATVPSVDPNAPVAPSGEVPVTSSNFSVNKQAGIVTVFATERQQKSIAQYLILLRKAVTAQVLIEAKVLEVSLSDEFSAGIDWEILDAGPGNKFDLGLYSVGTSTTSPAFTEPANKVFSMFFESGQDIGALVEAVSRFGTVKALASPRLTVMNNQSAVLNVSTNRVFFDLDITYTPSSTIGVDPTVTVDSETRTVPEGVLINVQPSIDLDRNSISMALRPTVTRVTGTINDPGVAFAAAQAAAGGVTDVSTLNSPVPIVNVQEMDSVVKMNSGQAIVMGGLMQDRAESQQEGVPVLSEIPYLGALFRSQVDSIQKTELVVFIRATIINDDKDSIHQTDKDFYKQFSGDRRPLKM